MNLVVIPARGGSKRIPRKNIKHFCGKPMMAWSIESAKAARIFDRIIVSTDDIEIAEVARAYGAEIPFIRPSDLSNDHVTIDAVFLHAIQWTIDHGSNVDYACCLFATAPFVQKEYLLEGLRLVKDVGAASTVSVTSYDHPIFRAFTVIPDGRIKMLWPEHRLTRSQDLPETYHDAGQFCWVNVKKYLVEQRILGDDVYPLILPRHMVQDIDTLEDWNVAERMMKSFTRLCKEDE